MFLPQQQEILSKSWCMHMLGEEFVFYLGNHTVVHQTREFYAVRKSILKLTNAIFSMHGQMDTTGNIFQILLKSNKSILRFIRHWPQMLAQFSLLTVKEVILQSIENNRGIP